MSNVFVSRVSKTRGKVKKIRKIRKTTIYLLVFLFALHTTPTVYVNSSFLSQFISEKRVGFIFSIASIFTIITYLYIGKILSKFGNYKTVLALALLEVVILLTMALSTIPYLVIGAYTLGFIVRWIILFNIDMFLESISVDESTGSVRGIFLTSLNTAFIIGPIVAGIILTNGDFWKVYLLSSILMIPVLFIIVKYLKDFKDPKYEKPQVIKALKEIYDRCDLFGVFISNFLLRFFYSWMIIYTPIYLHNHIGFEFSEIVIIMGLALIPFILLEGFLGWVSDKYIGEKEILTAGFLITAVSTASIAFINIPSFWLWVGILFMTRIGASMIEVMSEIYLFKKVNGEDLDIISSFRIIRPVAYVVSPAIASILLTVVDFRFLFLILGAIMLYGVRYSLAIRDTL